MLVLEGVADTLIDEAARGEGEAQRLDTRQATVTRTDGAGDVFRHLNI